MRKLLTSNKESDVTCEALLEDEDLKRHFTREQLEKLMEPFMVDFRKCLEDSLAKSGKLSLKLRTHEW
jgi:molecular chaperone DnaK (HSP70)